MQDNTSFQKSLRVSQLLSIGKIEIPQYQRSYSWEKKEISQFIEDLKEQNKKAFYLGQFLFEESNQTFSVIDGQQRLTTLVIFFAAVIRVLKEKIGAEGETLGPTCESLSKYTSGQFSTTPEDTSIFQKITQMRICPAIYEAETQSQKRIIEAFNFFQEELSCLDEETIISLSQTLETAATTPVILNQVQGAQIFDYQNNRGKELTQFEIIKAYLIHQIFLHSSSQSACEDALKKIRDFSFGIYRNFDLVEGFFSESELLNISTMLFFGTEGRIAEIKTKVKKEIDKPKWILDFFFWLSQVTQSAKAIVRAINKAPYGPKIMNLFLLGDEVNWKFVLISIFLKGNIVPESFSKVLKALEIISFKVKLGDYRSDHLPSYAINYYKNDDHECFQELFRSLIDVARKGFKWYWNEKDAFDKIIWTYFIEKTYHYETGIIKYVLWQYENSLRMDLKTGVLMDYSLYKNYTIEHISPQNPKIEKNTDDFVKDFLHRAGNLALLTLEQNSKYKDKPFSEKKELFRENSLVSYSEIIKNENWDKVEIKERHDRICQFLKTHFSYPE